MDQHELNFDEKLLALLERIATALEKEVIVAEKGADATRDLAAMLEGEDAVAEAANPSN